MPKVYPRLALLLICLLCITGCSNLGLGKLVSVFSDGAIDIPDIESKLSISKLWSRKVANNFSDTYLKLIPWIDENNIYVSGASGEVAALTKKNGEYIWRKKLKSRISAGIGGGNKALVLGGQDGQVTALSIASGDILWEYSLGNQITAISKVLKGIIIVRTAKMIVAMDESDGDIRWRKEVSLAPLTIAGSSIPLLYKEWAFVGLDSGELLMLSLKDGTSIRSIRLGIDTGTTDLDRIVDIDGQMVVYKGVLYATAYQGQTVAVDLEQKRMMWVASRSSQVGLAVDKKKTFITTTHNQLVAMDRQSGKELWVNEFEWQPNLSVPVSIVGLILVSDDKGNIYWISKATGNILDLTRFSNGPVSSMQVVGKTLFIWDREGQLTSVQINGYRK